MKVFTITQVTLKNANSILIAEAVHMKTL